jgi:thiol-disulfide isomerase/thioredoxin
MTPAQLVTRNLAFIANDTLKGVYLAGTVKMFKSYEELTNTFAPYQKCLVTPLASQRYFNAMKTLNTMRKGAEGFNFSYPDITGKQVAFNDLKGKVVVVDVWATWCGPCKKELPFLQKLEEEYAGNPNVVFLGVSVDEEKDFAKWQQFVKDQKLGGTQVFAKGWSEISKFYSINAIPRFLVFDQQGKIVDIDAPRPSEPALKKLIDQTLQGS